MKRQRLSRESWIRAGLSELTAGGPAMLAAEPLARTLGTTKGSFYWHFKDVPDFQSAVVTEWQAAAFGEIVADLAQDGSPEQRLRRFGRRLLAAPHDLAMRAWGRADERVAKAVAQVDEERLKYLVSLLHRLGITNDDFARGCLAALVGLPEVAERTQAAQAFETLVDMVLALK